MKFRFHIPSIIIGMIIALLAIVAGYRKGMEQRVTAEDMPKSEWRVVEMTVTAGCACERCCGEFADGITASGHQIQRGDKFVAADKAIPFGTKVIVIGYNDNKPVPVLDRGGKIKGYHIDLYFDSHQEARRWGVKEKHPVYIPNT